MMRRSSQGAGVGALRVRNDGPITPKAHGRQPSSGRLSGGAGPSSNCNMGRLSNTRTSIGGNKRASLSTHNRQSIVGPPSKRRTSTRSYGHHELKQDPRPISDRHFKEKCIRELIEFLSKYSYPHPLNVKMLHSPSSKEFIRIFEFLYGFLVPGYKMLGKIEEQFPGTLKSLGYPFNISKSAMYAIGSPHTWPTLLAALTWLREQIELMILTDPDELIFPKNQDDFDSVPVSKLLYSHTEEAYRQFLLGEDTFDDLEAKLAKELRKNSPGGDLEALIHENKRLKNELQSLEEKSDPLIHLHDRLSSIKLDKDKMQHYTANLDQHFSHQTNLLKTQELEKETMDADLSLLKQAVARKQAVLQTQVFSQADIQRINMERRTLQDQLATLKADSEALETQAWEEERCLAKDQEGIKKKCERYNDMAQSLHLIPPTADNAHGQDFELRQSLEETHSDHFYDSIKPSLTRMKSQCIDRVHEMAEQRLHGQNMLDQLSDQCSEKQSLISSLEKKLEMSQDELGRKKMLQQQESDQCQLQIDELTAELRAIHGDSLSINEATQARDRERRRHEVMCTDHASKQDKYRGFLESAIALICEHKEEIQIHMKKLASETKKLLEKEKEKAKDQQT